MKQVAVLISNVGTGTNLQALIDAQKSAKLNCNIALVVSDAYDAYGLKRAKDAKISTAICLDARRLLPILKKFKIDLVALAGWKQIVLDEVLNIFKNRILNLHPGAVPESLDGKVRAPDGSEVLWN